MRTPQGTTFNSRSRAVDVNVKQVERLISTALGGMLLPRSFSRHTFTGALVTLAAAGALLYRGFSGHSHLYDALGMSTVEPIDVPTQVGSATSNTVSDTRTGQEQILVGYQAFLVDGGESFGAIREVSASHLLVYVENAGEFRVPVDAIESVHFQKVIFNGEQLEPTLREAISRAHDSESSP